MEIDPIRCQEFKISHHQSEDAVAVTWSGSAEKGPTTERSGAPFDWSLQEQA